MKREATLKLGVWGKAYDGPEQQRGYTYEQQPDNLDAWKIGLAFHAASKTFHADPTDQGLLLLKELQKQGYGVFTLNDSTNPKPAGGE